MDSLVRSFTEKASVLSCVAEVLPAASDVDNDQYTELVKTSLTLADIMKQYQSECAKAQAITNSFKELREELSDKSKEILDLVSKVPQCVLIMTNEAPNTAANSASKICEVERQGSVAPTGGKETKQGKKSKSKKIPQLTFATAEEFNSVPAYMKGKITYSDVNTAIELMNKAISEKYKIVYKVKPSNDYERRKKIDYKEQEDRSTAGYEFITEGDIVEFCERKLDKQLISILTIIRHVGKLKQVRAGKITKYLIKER